MEKWEILKKRLSDRRDAFKVNGNMTSTSWPYQWVLEEMKRIEEDIKKKEKKV